MLLWFEFYFTELIILLLTNITNNVRVRKSLYTLSAIIAIYFSAFRDGLGTDYRGYLIRMGHILRIDNDSDIELLFNAIKIIVHDTVLSPVFFFVFCSVITIWLFWKYLDNRQNKFAAVSIIIFLSIPGFYFNTFNVVRQYFSAAIFLYSLKYVQSKNLVNYLICISIACMMHTSAVVLYPLYFVLNHKYSVKIYILLAVSLIVAAYMLSPIITAISVLSDKYSVYLKPDQEASSSTFAVICLILVILYFLKFKIFREPLIEDRFPYMVVTVNLFILYTIFSFLTFINFYFYRLIFYFSASFCVIMPYVLNAYLKNKTLVTVFCLIFSLIYFISFIYSGQNNPEICSDELLPLSSLID